MSSWNGLLGGQNIANSFNPVQLNLNITVQNATVVAIGGNAAAANLNATGQSNRYLLAASNQRCMYCCEK